MTAIQNTMLPVGQLVARCKRAMRVLLMVLEIFLNDELVELLIRLLIRCDIS